LKQKNEELEKQLWKIVGGNSEKFRKFTGYYFDSFMYHFIYDNKCDDNDYCGHI
jgi:hypothetical protein